MDEKAKIVFKDGKCITDLSKDSWVEGKTLEDVLKVLSRGTKEGFGHHLGYTIVEAEKDRVLYMQPIKPEHRSSHGVLHGGILYSIADHVGGACAYTDLRAYVTLSGNLNNIGNTEDNVIFCEATTVHRGRTTVISRTVVKTKEGRILAEGTFTYFCINRPFKEMVRDTEGK